MNNDVCSPIWVIDNDGREYICQQTENCGKNKNMGSLSEEEKSTCKVVTNCLSKDSLENLNRLKFHF